MATAFEAITKRLAYYADTAVSKYQAVQWSDEGKLELANGTRPLAGVVEYGTDSADQVATVVTGIFPCIAGTANMAVGSLVTFGTATPGSAITLADGVEGTGYGVVVAASTSVGDLVGVAFFDAPIVQTA